MQQFKEFFLTNLKQFRKFWVNQIAISLLGVMVTLAILTLERNNPDIGNWPELLAAAFCGGMFCFLIYDLFYALGAKDYIRVNHQNAPEDKIKSVKITLIAYSPTLLVTIAAIIFKLCGFGDGYAVTSVIMNMCIHAMYSGLFFFLPDSFNVIAFPIGIGVTLFFAWLGYFIAYKDTSLRAIFGIKTKPYRE